MSLSSLILTLLIDHEINRDFFRENGSINEKQAGQHRPTRSDPKLPFPENCALHRGVLYSGATAISPAIVKLHGCDRGERRKTHLVYKFPGPMAAKLPACPRRNARAQSD